MKTASRAPALLAAVLLAAGAAAAAADPVEGIWQTRPDDNGNIGYVQIRPCGPAFCGTLIRSFDSAGKPMKSPNIGKRIVWDMKAEGQGRYGEGKVWSPDRNKTYAAKMKLSDDTLSVSGCILGGLICRDGGAWRRVK